MNACSDYKYMRINVQLMLHQNRLTTLMTEHHKKRPIEQYFYRKQVTLTPYSEFKKIFISRALLEESMMYYIIY